MAERGPRARPRRVTPPPEEPPVRPEMDGRGTLGQAQAGQHPVCSVAFCPICMVVSALGDARPELVEHLLVASREMLLAARAVIDARLETMEEQPTTGLQRIEIE